jgi:hypothetical protein
MAEEYTPEQERALNDLENLFVKIGKINEKNLAQVRSEEEWFSLGIRKFKRQLVGLCGRTKLTYAREIQNRLWSLTKETYTLETIDKLVLNLPDNFELPPTKYAQFVHFVRVSHSEDKREIPEDKLYRITVGYVK